MRLLLLLLLQPGVPFPVGSEQVSSEQGRTAQYKRHARRRLGSALSLRRHARPPCAHGPRHGGAGTTLPAA